MKKRIFAFLATICLGCGFVLFAACDQTPDNGDKDNDNVVNTVVFEKDTVTLQQGGWTRLLFAATLENEHVEFTSADESIVTVGATGYVQAYGKTGTTTITITGTESKASDTCTVTVTEIALDFPDTEEEGILLLDSSAGSFSSQMPDHLTVSTDEGNNSVTQFKYDAEAATGGENWNNQIYYTTLGGIDLRECDSISFNLRGSGESVYFQIWNGVQQKSISTTATAGYGWTQTTLAFTDEQKTLLDPAESPLIIFVVPYPDAGYDGNGGTVELCGLWLSGYEHIEKELDIPSGEDVLRLDDQEGAQFVLENSAMNDHMTIAPDTENPDITKVTYDETAAADTNWSNKVRLDPAAGTVFHTSNAICFNIRGNGEAVHFQVWNGTKAVVAQQVTAGAEWNTVTVTFDDEAKQDFAASDTLQVLFTIPVPNANYSGTGGTVEIGGVWLSGYTRPEPPTYTIPDAGIARLDGSYNNGGEVTNSKNGEVITINYPAVSSDASDDWGNYIQFNVSEDASRTGYNQFELNIKGAAGVRVYVKLAQSDWTSIKEQAVTLTGEWQRVTFAIETEQQQHLAGGLVVALYVPFPGTAAGTFDIAGIWLSASQAA